MSDEITRVVHTREAAHEAVTLLYAQAKLLLADGKPVKLSVSPFYEELSARQRRFFHGPVLNQIAEQVRMPDGSRYVAKVWKEYFRDLFLPARWVVERRPKWCPKTQRVVLAKRATPRMEKRSTEELNVKQYSELIEKVLAHAASEFGVVFDLDPREREAVRYVPKPRAKKALQQQEEAIA